MPQSSIETPVFDRVTAPRNSGKAAAQATAIEAAFGEWLEAYFKVEVPVAESVMTAFNEKLPYKTARFENAARFVIDAARAAVVARIRAERSGITALARSHLRDALCTGGSVADVASRVITETLYFCVSSAFSEVSRLANDCDWVADHAAELLTEAPERAAARVAANARLEKLYDALNIVRTIDKRMQVAGPGAAVASAAAAAATPGDAEPEADPAPKASVLSAME